MWYPRKINSIKRCINGSVAIEFSLLWPIFAVMIVATTEIARLGVIDQKGTLVAFAMADLTTRNESVTIAQLESFANAAQVIIKPFDITGSTVIISSVASSENSGGGGGGGPIGTPIGFKSVSITPVAIAPVEGGGGSTGSKSYKNRIMWQHTSLGSAPSNIGTTGQKATLPNGYTLEKSQNAIVGEYKYRFTPILPITGFIIPALAPHELYFIAIMKPRQGTLLNPPT